MIFLSCSGKIVTTCSKKVRFFEQALFLSLCPSLATLKFVKSNTCRSRRCRNRSSKSLNGSPLLVNFPLNSQVFFPTTCLRYSDGVKLACFLKLKLKEDLELHPASNAIARIVKWRFAGSAKLFSLFRGDTHWQNQKSSVAVGYWWFRRDYAMRLTAFRQLV